MAEIIHNEVWSRLKQISQQPAARKVSWMVRAALVADEQSFELVQPGEGALDDPAVTTESGAVVGLAACDLGFDAASMELAASSGGRRRDPP